MSDSFSHASDYLALDGPFCRQLPGYQVRDSQLGLSDAIETALHTSSILTAEAGTGIGKTFAYLIPAILSAEKVVISTGTRHLQDQLFHSDLPRVIKALKLETRTALLKGRSNYLCYHRLKLAPHLGFVNRETAALLNQIDEWSQQTQSGDIAELSRIAEDSHVWSMVTSTTDNCLGGECECWSECFVVKARKKAQEAEVLVINHHLLLADLTLKNEGFAELLPDVSAFIIDEAHQLHDIASRFFGDTLSNRQLISLAKDVIAEQLSEAPDMAQLRDAAEALEKAARDFRLILGESALREAWQKINNKPAVHTGLENINTAIKDLSAILQLAAERGHGLEQCNDRCQLLQAGLQPFLLPSSLASQTNDGLQPSDDDTAEDLLVEKVLWYETFSRSFILHATPVDIASLFKQHTRQFEKAWVFTSATLQVNHSFAHFSRNLGIDGLGERLQSGVWDSPFDYQQQSLLYLPASLPQPAEHNYTSCFIEAALPVLKASRGRAFILFTSYRAMHQAHDLLKDRLPYPLLVQGDLPRHQLLESFRKTQHAVLLGTSSFWEGVDVRGKALSCVIIDRLPFASPGDPVMQARIDAIKKQGGHPFMDFQVPQAVIALKQGVGRLIRDVKDRGVVMIGDPRLRQKSYGRIFLNSLPAMPQTSKIEEVLAFFEQENITDSMPENNAERTG